MECEKCWCSHFEKINGKYTGKIICGAGNSPNDCGCTLMKIGGIYKGFVEGDDTKILVKQEKDIEYYQ